jgi:hypothetical protein
VKDEVSSQGPRSLRDDDISATDVPRRKFLGTVILRSAVVAAAMVAASCSGADDCDNDVTRFRDSDSRDLTTIAADACDTDRN